MILGRQMITLPEGVVQRTAKLPAGLVAHTVRVRMLTRMLAERHGVDTEASELGAACHDIARHLDPKDLLEEAESLGIDVHPIERRVPIMLHGPVASVWLQRDQEVLDPRVIEAVRHHTTGISGMSMVAKAVFLADKLEPNKVQRRPSLGEVLQLASVDIDTAMLEYLNREIVRRVERGDLIHPSTLELRNELATCLPGSDLVTGEKLPIENRIER